MQRKLFILVLIIVLMCSALTACNKQSKSLYPTNEEGYKFLESISELDKSEQELLLKSANKSFENYINTSDGLDFDNYEFCGWVFVSCKCEDKLHDAPSSTNRITNCLCFSEHSDGSHCVDEHSLNFNTFYYVYKDLLCDDEAYLIATIKNLLIKDNKIVLTKFMSTADGGGPLFDVNWETLSLDTSHQISKDDFEVKTTTEIIPEYYVDRFKIESNFLKK